MNLTELHKKFNTQKKCIAYLEKLRWKKKVFCPDGHIWYKGAIVSTPDEDAMFRIMGSSFIEPTNRK